MISAGLGRRLAAAFYDSLIILSLWIFTTFIEILFRHGEAIAPGTLWYQGQLLFIVAVYYAVFFYYSGQTIGMMAWRIKLRAYSHATLNIKTISLRILAYGVNILSLGTGFWWIAFKRDHITWYDKVSHTYVDCVANVRYSK